MIRIAVSNHPRHIDFWLIVWYNFFNEEVHTVLIFEPLRRN
nr:MAG TPA: hypothetical protein [Caudoviricetes sp.]DAO46516.1 MAG TPA: hypothetical protein [Caudoviricetes sp.]DAP72410.1 MAG TPA: hypothetical protein [Caudoviricetes sp.]DAR52067.1 MAG TPA: hypothetical protein [Bacteriophage sp.]DAU70053.1 MAG TPA: hypothetical protein [Bacteriophage sp.]